MGIRAYIPSPHPYGSEGKRLAKMGLDLSSRNDSIIHSINENEKEKIRNYSDLDILDDSQSRDSNKRNYNQNKIEELCLLEQDSFEDNLYVERLLDSNYPSLQVNIIFFIRFPLPLLSLCIFTIVSQN